MRSLGREDVVDIWHPDNQKDFFVTILPYQAYWLFCLLYNRGTCGDSS